MTIIFLEIVSKNGMIDQRSKSLVNNYNDVAVQVVLKGLSQSDRSLRPPKNQNGVPLLPPLLLNCIRKPTKLAVKECQELPAIYL